MRGFVEFEIIEVGYNCQIDIPESVAVCPICGAKLTSEVDSWTQDENGLWYADPVKLNCSTEPEDIGSIEWNDWFSGHWSTPYVDWLPLEIEVTEWAKRKYRFELE